jgi:DNA-binding transcriptional ArsR family regulator
MSEVSCVAALKALAEETRLRILRLLLKEQLSVNQLSGRLQVSQYNISKHLRIMRHTGLVETEKKGQRRLYAVADTVKLRVAANKYTLDFGCCTFSLSKSSR